MRRLHQLAEEELFAWKEARKAVGWQIYGQDSYRRYNLVDVMEELMDAEVILDRFEERLQRQGFTLFSDQYMELMAIRDCLAQAKTLIRRLDFSLPDSVCTDETGGKRIWWNERHPKKEETR